MPPAVEFLQHEGDDPAGRGGLGQVVEEDDDFLLPLGQLAELRAAEGILQRRPHLVVGQRGLVVPRHPALGHLPAGGNASSISRSSNQPPTRKLTFRVVMIEPRILI